MRRTVLLLALGLGVLAAPAGGTDRGGVAASLCSSIDSDLEAIAGCEAEWRPAELVRRAQAALAELGWAVTPDGVLGPVTRDALEQEGAPSTEAGLDEAAVAALEERAMERREAERQQRERQQVLVRRAQTALAGLGRQVGALDGKLGSATRRALDEERVPLTGGILDEAAVAALEARAAAERAEDDRRRVAEEEARRHAEERQQEDEARQLAEAERQRREAEEARRRAEAQRLADEQRAREQAEAQARAQAAAVPAPPPVDGRRVALVIGNGRYTVGGVPPLPNPPNDAADVAAALQRLGFQVFQDVNLDRPRMEDLVLDFARAAAEAEAEVTFVFYAGHGIQVNGVNYLLPVDTSVPDEIALRTLVRLDVLADDAGTAGKLAVLVVDACRDNPLADALERRSGPRRSLDAGRGLAAPRKLPARFLTAYATAADDVAADGRGRNSPYTTALLRHLVVRH